MKFRTELNCDVCGAVFPDEPVSLAGIMRDCGRNTRPHIQAKLLTEKYKIPPYCLLCEDCFWMFRPKERPKSLTLPVFALLLSVFLFGFGVFIFMSGFHSLDLAQDITQLTYMLGGDPSAIYECNLAKECYHLPETYLDGVSNLFRGFFVSIASIIAVYTATLLIVKTAREVK